MLGSRRVYAQLDATSSPQKHRLILQRYFRRLARHYDRGLISRHELTGVIAGFSQAPTLRFGGTSDPYAEVIYLAMQLELPPQYRRSDIRWDEFMEKLEALA